MNSCPAVLRHSKRVDGKDAWELKNMFFKEELMNHVITPEYHGTPKLSENDFYAPNRHPEKQRKYYGHKESNWIGLSSGDYKSKLHSSSCNYQPCKRPTRYLSETLDLIYTPRSVIGEH